MLVYQSQYTVIPGHRRLYTIWKPNDIQLFALIQILADSTNEQETTYLVPVLSLSNLYHILSKLTFEDILWN